ncbi:MAG: hypothetical protein HQK98_09910 [Nitrospirae bacterium]|nr:hypothetical protein [Nitrospirota bacterium]
MQTYSINLKNNAITKYEGYDFNSIGTDGINYYATGGSPDPNVKVAGIYLLRGETDDGSPIKAHIRTGHHDFDTSFTKHFHECYLGIKAEGDVDLVLVMDDNIADTYHFENEGTPQAHTLKVHLGKGNRTRYITMEINNFEDGGYFEVGTIELYGEVLSRRFNG